MGCSRGQTWWGRTWELGDRSVINNTASGRHRMEDWADTAPAWQLPLPPPSPVYLHPLPLLPLSFLITSSLCIIPPPTSCETHDDVGVCALTPEGASSDGVQCWQAGASLSCCTPPTADHHLPVSPGQERPPGWEHKGSLPKEDPYRLAGLLSLSYTISSKGKLQAPCAVISQKRVRSGICSAPPLTPDMCLFFYQLLHPPLWCSEVFTHPTMPPSLPLLHHLSLDFVVSSPFPFPLRVSRVLINAIK